MSQINEQLILSKTAFFYSPTKLILQPGAVDFVGIEAKELKVKRALIITDPEVYKAGLIDSIQNALSESGMFVDIFDKVEPEPPVRVITHAAELVKKNGYDIIVGIGGGSTMDTSKGASVLATNEGKLIDYVGMNKILKRGIPKILIPTTAGSGAEMTRVFATTDESDNTKKVIYSPYNLAEVVILDPNLTISLPSIITAECGLDALAHAVESYVSKNSTPFSDVLGVEAIRLITENLPVAVVKRADIQAKYQMLLAASLAGLSWASSGLGVNHAIAYVLEDLYKIGHARAVSIMMPHVMAYNSIGNIKKYKKIAEIMGSDTNKMLSLDAAISASKAVECFINRLGISTYLPDYGATEKDISKIIEGTLMHERLFISNPRDISSKDIEIIVRSAMSKRNNDS